MSGNPTTSTSSPCKVNVSHWYKILYCCYSNLWTQCCLLKYHMTCLILCKNISSLKPLFKLHFLFHFTSNPSCFVLGVYKYTGTSNLFQKCMVSFLDTAWVPVYLWGKAASIINLSLCFHLGALDLSHTLNFTSLLQFVTASRVLSQPLLRPAVVFTPQTSNRLPQSGESSVLHGLAWAAARYLVFSFG